MEKVSVIIPVYNVEKYIEECLLSIINQTYRNLEIIVIDDGSKDNSGAICDEYAKKDDRIQVVHTKNQGAANAKNEGLNRVTGEYFCFVDADDYYELNFIDLMLSVLKSHKCEIVQCQFANVYVDKEEPYTECTEVSVFSSEDFMKDFSLRWQDALFCNKLFKTEVLKDIRFLQHRCIDDEFFTYKLVLNSKKVVEIPQVLYKYRMRKSSVTKTPEVKKQILLDQVDFSTERYEYIRNNYPSLRNHMLEYMISVYIQVLTNGYRDTEVVSYLKKRIKKYKLDILFRNYDLRTKISLFRILIKDNKCNYNAESENFGNENYFE